MRRTVAVGILGMALVFTAAPGVGAHEVKEEEPAVALIQEAIAILASQPEQHDEAIERSEDALDSDETRGVHLDLVRQAVEALEAEELDRGLVLLERSIGTCPGAPVIDPEHAPRHPPPLESPCPDLPHLQALERTRVGGAQSPTFLVIGGVLILSGLVLSRRVIR